MAFQAHSPTSVSAETPVPHPGPGGMLATSSRDVEPMAFPLPLPHHQEQLQRLAAHLRHGEEAMQDS